MTRIISVGYQQRSVSEVIAILTKYKVDKLIDVRELPLSRKKGFSKKGLSKRLSKSGIEYRHVREAGNPYRKVKQNIAKCLSLYTRYLARNLDVLGLIEEELNSKPIAVLCFERDHEKCHRSVLLDFIKQRNRSIQVIEV